MDISEMIFWLVFSCGGRDGHNGRDVGAYGIRPGECHSPLRFHHLRDVAENVGEVDAVGFEAARGFERGSTRHEQGDCRLLRILAEGVVNEQFPVPHDFDCHGDERKVRRRFCIWFVHGWYSRTFSFGNEPS